MARKLLVLVLSFMLCTVSAMAAPRHMARSSDKRPQAPPPPSKDPWYTAPRGYEHAAPGDILKTRRASGLTKIVANSSAAYNILYRTTDSNYQPSWAVTTLFAPSGYPTRNGGKLVSYQIPYDTADVDGSPSYTFYGGDTDPSITISLGLGWYVSSPDYEGPLAAFTAGVQSGHATIDSVRAVLNFEAGPGHNAKYAMWGYSGGALASEWAAELQVQYAPNLDFAGVALGGLTPNSTSVLLTINGGPAVELAVNAILGLTAEDPAARQYIVGDLKTSGPFNKTGFLAALHQNTTVDTIEYYDQNAFNYFKSGSAVLQAPVIASLVDRDSIMGYHGVPAMPVFAYKAIHDEISVVADTDALVARYCADGANIVYQRNTVGGHVAEATNGGPSALEFLATVLEGGNHQTAGCTVQNVTISTDPSPE